MAVGLGNASSFENSGLALNYTYGFPILPASSLKGIARYWLFEDPTLETVIGSDCTKQDLPSYPKGQSLAEFLFGTAKGPTDENEDGEAHDSTDASGDDGHAALIRLHDAWPTSRPSNGWFDVDVLTAHHPNYYGEGNKQQQLAFDSDGPNPVHFLTLRPGSTFSIPIGLTSLGRKLSDKDAAACMKLVCGILQSALQHVGVGAKTGSGYGLMQSTQERTLP
jgi:CRISPR-associated protein Cmr6